MSITCLLLVLEIRDGKPSYRKSWDVNFLVWLEFFIGPLLQDRARILYLQYFFNYVLTYFLHLNNYLVTFLHNTICRAQLFCPFLLSASEFLLNMLFNYHLLYFCTALSLIIMLSSHYHLHKSKTLIQLTQCLFTGTLLLFMIIYTALYFVPFNITLLLLYVVRLTIPFIYFAILMFTRVLLLYIIFAVG